MKLATTSFENPEIFKSIQGEGKSIGKPCIFVRLSRCNLHCYWCDTAYTWNFNGTDFVHRDDRGSKPKKYDMNTEIFDIDVQHLKEKIISIGVNRVIFTGGEPLLQQAELGKLLKLLKHSNTSMFIEVETNGTILPKGEFRDLVDQFNVSPKLAHSRNDISVRRKNLALNFFSQDKRTFFKFVVQEKDDLVEIRELVNIYKIRPETVYLMPEGVDSKTIKDRSRWLVSESLQNGYNFTDRLHIHLFGDTRGT